MTGRLSPSCNRLMDGPVSRQTELPHKIGDTSRFWSWKHSEKSSSDITSLKQFAPLLQAQENEPRGGN